MDLKAVTKKMQEVLDTHGWAVVDLDRNFHYDEDMLESLSLWRLGPLYTGSHVGVLPAKDLRRGLWSQQNNKWFKEGRGAAWAVCDPETNLVLCGAAVLVSFAKGTRLESLTKADVFSNGKG